MIQDPPAHPLVAVPSESHPPRPWSPTPLKGLTGESNRSSDLAPADEQPSPDGLSPAAPSAWVTKLRETSPSEPLGNTELGRVPVQEDGTLPTTPCSDPDQLLDAARLKAKQIIEGARAEVEMQGESARARGYADGIAAGEAECAEKLAQYVRLVQSLDAEFAQFCLAQVPDLANLAVTAAERIVQEQITLEPERILTIVAAAMEEANWGSLVNDVTAIGAGTQVEPPLPAVGDASSRSGAEHRSAGGPSVYLHPDDLQLILSHSLPANLTQISLQPDPSIERGGCRIRWSSGEVDATVSGAITRLDRLFR